jgi:alpha-ribazole phosphatase
LTIYLVRHTRPAVDPGLCYGAADVLLDAAQFAQDASRIHAQLPHDVHLIASPLSRCAALAQALHAQSPTRTLSFDTRLAEMSFGRWQGLRWGDIERTEIDAWAADFWHYNAHGGESVAQLRSRVQELWDELQSSAHAIVLVTHAGPMQVIHASLNGRDLATQRFNIAYGEVLAI